MNFLTEAILNPYLREFSHPKNLKMCDPILVTLLKMPPHSSQNATPSSGTSPLASYKEVNPRVTSVILKLIAKHLPKQHKYHNRFNKNNAKVSYSCMDNMKSIINKHNKKVTNADNDTNTDTQVQCNCRNKDQYPLDNKCLTSSVIYNAQVTTNNATKNYIGLTEGTFKQRFSQHKATFKHRKYTNNTELSKYIWKLRDNNQDFNIKWTIIRRARPYNNISKRCDLCLTEKLMIITADPDSIPSKRSELISKCRHENKFYLTNN